MLEFGYGVGDDDNKIIKRNFKRRDEIKGNGIIYEKDVIKKLFNEEKAKWLKLSGEIMSKLGKNPEKINLYSKIIKRIHDKIFKHLLGKKRIDEHLMRAVFVGSTIPEDQTFIIYDTRDELMKKGMAILHKTIIEIEGINLEEIDELLEKGTETISRSGNEEKNILKEWEKFMTEIEREIKQRDDDEVENPLKEVA